MRVPPAMIVHSGAGSGKFPKSDRRLKELRNALEEGVAAMRKGTSLDGVVAAVSLMEESGAFNAGRGSCLTIDGRLELDAAVMRGDTRQGAGVAVVTCTYHPVSLAKWLMENTRHVLVAGPECAAYAKRAGMAVERLAPSEASRARSEELMREPKGTARENARFWKKMQGGGTVGAVAVDADGVPSAAVSTGGMWLKLPGRVGDSAILGAGIYADAKRGAACATGNGEEIIRSALCLKACEFLAGESAPTAARQAIAVLSRKSGKGSGGIITVDTKGRVGASWNTEAMGRGWYDGRTGSVTVRI